MENIDISYGKFTNLVAEITSYGDSIFSEQDSRVKVIDRILIEILGWEYKNILTEPKTGKGFLDYGLKIGHAYRAIIEAKRDGKDFSIDDKYSGRAYKLNGPVFSDPVVRDGIDQAIYYCAHKGAELAVLTNGRQWIIFKGNRMGDGKEILEGFGFVFSSLSSISTHFKLFYDLLYQNYVKDFNFRTLFQEVEGQIIRAKTFSKSVFSQSQLRTIPRDEYSSDLDRIMGIFFKRLDGQDDPDFAKRCFVHTEESDAARGKLEKISRDIIESIRKIESRKGAELEKLISRVKASQKHAFVVLVGGKGAGKSTFIDLFFEDVLSHDLKDDCILLKLDLKKSEGDEKRIIDWLNAKFLEECEKKVFGGAPTDLELQGMFFDEYQRRKRAFRYLYEKDKTEFKIDFAKHIENIRENNPAHYIKRVVGNITRNRKKVPCIVFDNTDHFSIDFQERVFQYAMSIYEEEVCLIIVPITDKTNWQLSKQGALQSFEDIEALYLPTPSPKKIIEKRIVYLQERIKRESVASPDYLFGISMKLKISDLEGFVYYLHEVFLQNRQVATWIGNLGNLDIRRCLIISRNLIASPHLNLTELIKVYISSTLSSRNIKDHRLLDALFRGKHTLYPVNQNEFVQNVYNLSDEVYTSPLITLRLLQLLYDSHNSYSALESYIEVSRILNYMSSLGIDNGVVLHYLDIMLKKGLCLSYDPTVTEIANATSVEISPSGKQHYFWGVHDYKYLDTMLEVTPIYDEDFYYRISNNRYDKNTDWSQLKIDFINYLISQDALFLKIPEHESFEGQRILNYKLGRKNIETLQGCGSILM